MHVEKTLKCPMNVDEKSKWKSSKAKAQAFIILNVEASQLTYIRKCKIAKEMWNRLEYFSKIHKS